VPILLAIALGFSLLIVAMAATTPWLLPRLPRPALVVVYERRDAVIFGALTIAFGIALGLMIAVVG